MSLPVRVLSKRTKSNVDYNDEAPQPAASQHENAPDISANFTPPAPAKTGFIKTITNKIRRPSLRGHDESDHGFLLPGPRRAPLCVTRSTPAESLPACPERSTLPTLRDRRSVHGALTIDSSDVLAGSHQVLPECLRRPSQADLQSANQPLTPPMPSDIPPKVPERSPVSLGLMPSVVRTSPGLRRLSSLPAHCYEIPLQYDDQLSPATPLSPLARHSFPQRPLRALPPVPSDDIPPDDDDAPPEEDAPAPPVTANLLYRPPDETFCVTEELHQLAKRGWYWGPITRSEAEKRLAGQPDGTFLVRNSLDPRHILSLSFRSLQQSLHVRIKYENCKFSFYPHLNDRTYPSVVDLVENAMREATVCYSRSRAPDSPNFPIQLRYPVSRFAQVTSLKYLCRFVIRLHIRLDHLERTPLPVSIRRFISFPEGSA